MVVAGSELSGAVATEAAAKVAGVGARCWSADDAGVWSTALPENVAPLIVPSLMAKPTTPI